MKSVLTDNAGACESFYRTLCTNVLTQSFAGIQELQIIIWSQRWSASSTLLLSFRGSIEFSNKGRKTFLNLQIFGATLWSHWSSSPMYRFFFPVSAYRTTLFFFAYYYFIDSCQHTRLCTSLLWLNLGTSPLPLTRVHVYTQYTIEHTRVHSGLPYGPEALFDYLLQLCSVFFPHFFFSPPTFLALFSLTRHDCHVIIDVVSSHKKN